MTHPDPQGNPEDQNMIIEENGERQVIEKSEWLKCVQATHIVAERNPQLFGPEKAKNHHSLETALILGKYSDTPSSADFFPLTGVLLLKIKVKLVNGKFFLNQGFFP